MKHKESSQYGSVEKTTLISCLFFERNQTSVPLNLCPFAPLKKESFLTNV